MYSISFFTIFIDRAIELYSSVYSNYIQGRINHMCFVKINTCTYVNIKRNINSEITTTD